MKVRDVMDSNVVAVMPQEAVRQAAARMAVSGYPALPVVDDDGCLVGTISEFDLLKLLLPDYLSSLEDLSFLPADLEPGPLRYEDVACLPVAQAMRTDLMPTVAEDETVLEVIRMLVTARLRHAVVVRDGRVVGMVRSSDLVRLLLHPLDEGCGAS